MVLPQVLGGTVSPTPHAGGGEPGYVYIYLSNDNPTIQEVYFDDFKVEHVAKVAAIQTQDYYPFGLTFNEYSEGESPANKYLYNQGAGEKKFNTERVLALDLNVDQSLYRTFDFITGRWWQIDPKSENGGQESWSAYHYAFNNPIKNNDPEGDCPCIAPLVPFIIEGVVTVTELALSFVAAEMTVTAIDGVTQNGSTVETTSTSNANAGAHYMNGPPPTFDKQSNVNARSASDQKLIDLAKQETARREAAKARAEQRKEQTKKGNEKVGKSNQQTRGDHNSGGKSKADRQRHENAQPRRQREQEKADMKREESKKKN